MNVNEKGAIGLIEVIRDLTKKGYECFTPFHDYSGVDLIAMDSNYKTVRIQVKYRSTYRGVIEVGFRTTSMGKHTPINFDAIDGWAVYCPEIEKVVYISKSEVDLTKGGINFRLEEGLNRVNKGKNSIQLYSVFGEITAWK
jgi:hypothetical protein